MATSTVKTRVLIISDTHSTPLQPSTSKNHFRQPLPSADVLIHCGDLTMMGLLSEYERTLDMMAKIDAKVKLVIAGNHDRTLDGEWMRNHQTQLPVSQRELHEPAREFWFGEQGRAKREGVQLLEEGVHEIDLENGGMLTVYSSEYQPEFCDWAFPYWKHQDRYNPSGLSLKDAENIAVHPVPAYKDRRLDVLMTHGPPYKRGDITASGHVGCPHLLRAVARARPLVHCFGHIHEGWGAEVVEWGDREVRQEDEVSIDEWKDKGWEKHVKEVKTVECGKLMKDKRCVFVDASSGADNEVESGRQTLMVNAAIMDERYNPVNAPFLVDLDLPLKA